MRRVIATTLTIVYLAFVPFYFFSAATTHAPPYISVTECIKRPDIPSRPNRLFLRPLPLNFALACTRISRVHPLQQVFSSEHTPPLLFFLHGIPPSRFSLQKNSRDQQTTKTRCSTSLKYPCGSSSQRITPLPRSPERSGGSVERALGCCPARENRTS